LLPETDQRRLLAWERWGEVAAEATPYATLLFSSILALALQPVGVESGVLVALAAAWVYGMYTRARAPRTLQRLRMRVYFVGLLALTGVLMTRHPIFFVFGVSGFFHAPVLRPWPLTIVGVGLTSTLLNTVPTGFPWPTLDQWGLFLTIIVIQTVAIGFGSVMSERLSTLNEQRRQAVMQLEGALAENAGLQAQLLTQAREAGVLDERHRMAREIHDTLAQGLTGIITQLEAVKQAADRPSDWRRHLDNAARLARDSLAEARRSVAASRPELLDVEAEGAARLGNALAVAARQWSALTNTHVEVATTGEPQPLHTEIEVTLLRTAQEALANVAKHAHASRVGVTLSYMGDVVTLDVRDDGVGFEAPDPTVGRHAGFGLAAMRQRVNRVAGTLAVESAPGRGTAVSARVPAVLAQPTRSVS
jgi:signal transduction histidine kinase